MIWISMFYEFFKTGLLAAGGGLATLPFLYAMAAKTGWFTTMDIANMVAVSESTPGPLGVNMATYVGFQTLGILGGIWATISLTCPAIIVVTCISRAMKRFEHSVMVQKIFYGLRPASSALILAAGLGVMKIAFFTVAGGADAGWFSHVNWPVLALAVVIWGAYIKFRWHPIIYIALSAAAGIVFSL